MKRSEMIKLMEKAHQEYVHATLDVMHLDDWQEKIDDEYKGYDGYLDYILDKMVEAGMLPPKSKTIGHGSLAEEIYEWEEE